MDTVALIRRLKAEFGEHWGYLHNEGGNHGFIHPTPWDTPERAIRLERIFQTHGLPRDILPAHSTPLIIHHASRPGVWIREIETRENIRFQRNGSIIGWWQIGDRCILRPRQDLSCLKRAPRDPSSASAMETRKTGRIRSRR